MLENLAKMMFSQSVNATFLPFASLAVLLSATVAEASMTSDDTTRSLNSTKLPPKAQVIDSANFASMPSVLPPSEYDGRTVCSVNPELYDTPFEANCNVLDLDAAGHHATAAKGPAVPRLRF